MLMLPDGVLNNLRAIPGHVRNSSLILDSWGYARRMPYGHAVTALFAGPSGTGKTMAAQILANDLGVELFQVDLAKIVSKYIGETEKNLAEIFDAAERASAVLLFDEADALFGKRTEIRDAHDRYANIEVAYLLQRMESYAGLAVLTTNMRQNLDPAFNASASLCRRVPDSQFRRPGSHLASCLSGGGAARRRRQLSVSRSKN